MLSTLTKLIFAVTNVVVEILMYIQKFILLKAAFFLVGIQRSSLIINHFSFKCERYNWMPP